MVYVCVLQKSLWLTGRSYKHTDMSELTQIKPIVANEAELKQLAQDYGNLVVTTENVDAADKARPDIVERHFYLIEI